MAALSRDLQKESLAAARLSFLVPAGKSMCAGKLVVFIVSELPDLPADFPTGVGGCVNVRIGNVAGDRSNNVREVARGNSLVRRSDHVSSCHRVRHSPRVGGVVGTCGRASGPVAQVGAEKY